jgi:hypothetical protein
VASNGDEKGGGRVSKTRRKATPKSPAKTKKPAGARASAKTANGKANGKTGTEQELEKSTT